ncbi:MAG TPA: hypothetical protein VK586_27095 [Streptosporangiaceae bacterium]|nr:hypothetical protein [Streptosporangiaceae bacterium]
MPRTTLIQASAEDMRRYSELQERLRRQEAEKLRHADVFGKLGFAPNPGPQSRFLSLPDENIDVLYGGAAGGSKSTSLLLYSLRACARFPGLQAFWFRRTFPELEQSVMRMLGRYGYAKALGARWNEGKHELRFANGSILTFGHAKNTQEASALLSAEINLLVIDERTTIPPGVVDMLYSRVRSGVEGVPCLGVRSATNPGNVGHSRVKADYIKATAHGQKEITDRYNRRRIFIQARVTDTPQLGEEYRLNLAGLDEKLRKAFEEGDWDTFEGQVFPELSWDRHVVAPFTIPPGWRRYVGVDWGYTAPWAVGWFAVDEDGRVWLYREIYETQVGEADQARRILAAEAGDEHIAVRYADDAMWAVRGDAKPIADVYADNGCHLTPAGKGPGSRVAGWQRIHTYLKDGPACPHHRAAGQETCPMFHALTTCPKWFDELSELPHATTGNPEDSDPRAADHLADLTRYFLLNIDGGPQFTVFPDEEPNAVAAAITPLEPMGAFAYQRMADEPRWDADEDDTARRTVRSVE